MKRTINFCQQGDVQNPCPCRTVIPVHGDKPPTEYVKVCTSQFPQVCSKVPVEVDFQTRYIFCGPVGE